MGRKKKVEEINEIAPELAAAAEDGVITEDEIQDILDGKETTDETSETGSEEETVAETTDGVEETDTGDATGSEEETDTGDATGSEEETDSTGSGSEESSKDDTPSAPVDTEEEVPKLSLVAIAAVISDKDLTGKEKIEKLAAEATMAYASVASKILGYDQIMNPKVPVTEVAGVAKQYDLLNTLKSVINTEDYKQFKLKFDIVNLGFRAYGKDSFDEFMLFRFDQKWRWSKKDLTTSQHLATLISQLCDLSTRAENLKKIDIDRALDASQITLTETGISNLKKYYTM
jgi:hypothetical protein